MTSRFVTKTSLCLALATPVVLPLSACSSPGKDTPAASASAPASPAASGGPIDENLPPGDGPVARVNGVDIPREPFLREYRQTLDRYARAKHDMRPGLRERLKNNIVQRLVDAELIRQQATKLGVAVTPEEQKKAWEEYRARYGDDTKLKDFLEKAGTTAADLERQHSENMLREKVFESVGSKVEVTPEEVRALYEQNKERYAEPEQVRASHILLQVKDGTSAADKAKRKAEAEALAKEAAKKGADFEALAKKHSEDATASRGGDLGWFPRDRMVKPFEDAAFALKDGQVSGVVESPFGFHIIKKTGYKQASTQKFEDLAERIEKQALARERNQAIRDALEKWKAESKIELLVKGDDALIAADRASAPLGTVQQKLDAQRQAQPLPLDHTQAPVTRDTPAAPAVPAH